MEVSKLETNYRRPSLSSDERGGKSENVRFRCRIDKVESGSTSGFYKFTMLSVKDHCCASPISNL